jgi:hypothetical protein
MNKVRSLAKFVPRGNKLAALLYVLFFALLLSRAARGVGQYWDWVFPYYPDQIGNFFGRAAESWTRDANGSPLGYSTDYLLRFVISLFRFVSPELLLYVVLVATFSTGAYVTYLIAHRHTKSVLAFLLGLVAFVNPVIFYNFTAGYVDYLVSYTAFIYLTYYLLYRFRPDLRSVVVVGLLITVIGVQIQLFAVAGVLVLLFFLFRSEDFRWKYVPVMLGLPVLISLVWLSNFIFGGANLSEISGSAAKATFKGLADSNYLNIFGFSFAKATLISRFYTVYELLLYGLFFTLIVVLLLKAKRKQADDVFLLSFMLLMLFLATGLFQLINLGPITMLYPMFREVGHFAPLILLPIVVLMARLMGRGAIKWLVAVWLVVVIVISFGKFQAHTQSIDFASVRQQFAEFKNFGDKHPDVDHRVLSYPFFDQYAFTKFPMHFQDNLPLRNSGHDSYTAFAGEQFVKNAVKPADFKGSLQNRLLQTMDVDVLQPYNVKYIYDFSGVYESYYDRYVSPVTYDNDISLIKNNPYFLEQLVQANPGKVKQVSPHILEVLDATPRVGAADKVYAVDSAEAGEDSRGFMEHIAPGQVYNYAADTAQAKDTPYGSVAPLFADASNPKLLNVAQKSLQQQVVIPSGNKPTLYSNSAPRNLSYRITGRTLTFSASSSGKLYANDQLVADYDATDDKTLGSMQMQQGVQYYASLNGSIVPLNGKNGGRIGTIMTASTFQVFAADTTNIVSNPSFESGLWTDKVNDCNAYDKSPDIAMRADNTTATDGKQSLELSARRHDACTYATFGMKPNATYLLSYDYKGQNAQSASFYLRFNNADKDAIKRFQGISDADWHTTTQLVKTPDGTSNGELTLHATASDTDTPTVNHYDNVRAVQLVQLGSLDIPQPNAKYVTHDLPKSDSLTFRLQDDSFDYRNVIQNPSFEQGAWQDKVIDCNNYDKNGSIAGSISKSSHTDGGQSLQLEATKHTACEYTNVTVQPDTDYLLSFDYQGDPAQQAGYYLEYTGEGMGHQDRVDMDDRSWHTYTTRVHIPETVTDVRLYLHAYESNGTAKNIVRFDNLKLTAVPTTESQFYVMSEPMAPMQKPQNVSFKTIDDTHRQVDVKGAKSGFVVNLSESYHPQWRLELRNEKVSGTAAWLPGAKADSVDAHFEINNYANAWYVDPAKLCAHNAVGCTRNADGSYDIQLLAEFVPQRWFTINRAISVTTLLLAGGYIVVTHRKYKRLLQAEGTYKHPLAHRRKKK